MATTRRTWGRREFLGTIAAAGAAGALGAAGPVRPLGALGSPSARPGLGMAALPGRDASAPAADPPRRRDIKLGFDNFSIRSFGWKAPRLIEYAASVGADVLLISDLDSFDSREEPYLKTVRELAKDKGIELQVGTGSICPTSRSYNAAKLGPAQDHLRLLIRVAKALGSSVARCYLGTRADRDGEGGIYRHIEETVKVTRSVRAEALDAGVKIAIENHAGDMQAWELAELIEAAGKDHVGATMDSGNATWTMEDPMVNLEILGPLAVTTGMRDTSMWETETGAIGMVWSNMGEGVVDWSAYLDRYATICPKAPFVLEILSYTWPREAAVLDPKTWDVFPRARASELARFLALAKRGRKYVVPEGRPSGSASKELEQAQQRWDLEASLRYSREVLGLGMRG